MSANAKRRRAIAGHPRVRVGAEGAAAAAAEASDASQGSGGDLAAVTVALLCRRRELRVASYLETSHEAVQSRRSNVSRISAALFTQFAVHLAVLFTTSGTVAQNKWVFPSLSVYFSSLCIFALSHDVFLLIQ